MSNKMQPHTQFILSVNCSTCFGWLLNTSTIATGSNNSWLDTAICAPDDGCRNHPKHVEQFTDKINCVWLRLVGHLLTCPNEHVTKVYGGVEIQLLASLSWALYRSEWWVSPSRPFYPQVKLSLPFEYEIRWFSEGVLTLWRREKSLACVGNRTQTWWSSNPP